MSKIFMVLVAAAAMTGSAFAADLPSRQVPPLAYVPPAPILTWTGFYVG
jgi:outer membrane immunogenic protein